LGRSGTAATWLGRQAEVGRGAALGLRGVEQADRPEGGKGGRKTFAFLFSKI